MEQQGYDVSYISNLDTHADPARLLRAKAFLSVGHDEYWSLDMYDHVKRAIDARRPRGVLLRQLGRWRARHPRRQSRRGRIARSSASASSAGRIPSASGALQKPWKQHGPDPAALMGADTTSPANGTADWTCTNDKHWLFAGTGMKNGDSIKGLVGWEHHGPPLAEVAGLEVLARGPVSSRGRPQNTEYTATMYPGPKGNLVFNAATIWWSDGLSEPPGYLRPPPTAARRRAPTSACSG